MNTYTVIAYPEGRRRVLSVLYGSGNQEDQIALAAARAGVSPGSEADGVVNHVVRLARLRSGYVDLCRNGELIAVIGPEGVV